MRRRCLIATAVVAVACLACASVGPAWAAPPAKAQADLPADESREIRTWTLKKGTTVEARLLETKGGTNVLQKEDGSKMKVHRSGLSPADLEYIQTVRDTAPAAEEQEGEEQQEGEEEQAAEPVNAKGGKRDAKMTAKSVSVTLVRGPKAGPKKPSNDVTMEFVRVEPGQFMMGSPVHTWGGAVHPVTISKPYYIGKFEVTVKQWHAFVAATGFVTGAERANDCWGWMQGRGVGHAPINWRKLGFEQTPDHPVVCVNQLEAKAFCQWASGLAGKQIRLPTEAEWEYACRGPQGHIWPGGGEPNLATFNHADASCKKAGVDSNQWSDMADDGFAYTAPVGSLPANTTWCGALDMHGNVREWVLDKFAPFPPGPAVDPVYPNNDDPGMITARRGGGWRDHFYFADGGRRDEHPAGDSNDELGFRCVLVP